MQSLTGRFMASLQSLPVHMLKDSAIGFLHLQDLELLCIPGDDAQIAGLPPRLGMKCSRLQGDYILRGHHYRRLKGSEIGVL
jgi:hypothetical protein